MSRAFSKKVIPFRSVRHLPLSLPFTVRSEMKAAQISGFPEFESVEPFPAGSWKQLPAFAPNTLLGYGYDLLRLAAKAANGEILLPSVDHAIFALTDCGASPITDVLRVTLWQTFGVPVYELIVAPGFRLLAAECEAHDGWHLSSDTKAYLRLGDLLYDAPHARGLHSGFAATIDEEPCGCGRQTQRLKALIPRLPRSFDQPLGATA